MATTQPSVKEKMVQIIERQPEGSSFDEILRELAFARMIEVRRQVESWGT